MTLLRTVLGNRNLARLEVVWAASALGNWAFSILLSLFAYREGGTGMVAIALVVRMLPAGLLAPYAGLLADRHSRRLVLVRSSVVRAGALLGAAVVAPVLGLPGVLAFAAVFTAAGTAHRPAQAALMPQLARTPAELAAANVCWSAIDYAGFLAGSVLAGALAALTGLGVAFAACGVAFVACAVIARTLPADSPPPEPEEPLGRGAELAEGIRTVWAHPEIRLLVGVFGTETLIQGVFDVLVVVAAIGLLDLGESGAGWLNAAWGVGGTAGGVVAMAMLGRGRLSAGVAAGLVVTGVSFAAIGAWPSAAAALVLLVVMGVGFAVLEAALLTLTQRLAADDVLGRVFGVQETVEVAALALGSLLAAALVGVLGIGGAMIAAGLVLPVVAAIVVRPLAGSEAGAPVPQRAFALLRRVPIFAPLPMATVENLALRAGLRRCAAGEAIVTQGDVGDAFFVIADGRVRVAIDGELRRHEGPGEFFGEIALVRDVPRTATVTAVDPVEVLVVDREHFLGAIDAHPRSARAAESVARDRLLAGAVAAPP